MTVEMLVGLNVINAERYQSYRQAIAPLLARAGGHFGYDFRIAAVLKSPTEAPINRVFTLRFPSSEAMDAFFATRDYQAAKQADFEVAVADTTILATYEC